MQIKKNSTAGTLESCDIYITIESSEENEVVITSSVEKQYGKRIREIIENVILELKLNGVKINATDRGALDCTIKARMLTAIQRATEEKICL